MSKQTEESLVIGIELDVTRLARNNRPQKYEELSEALMESLFANIQFKDNFEIERMVHAVCTHARSRGSEAMIRLREGRPNP